jgi:hypothetical protein
LDEPIKFGDRSFPIGCSLNILSLAAYGTGVELAKYVALVHAFPNPSAWRFYLRRTLVPIDDHDLNLLLEVLADIAVSPGEVLPEYVERGIRRITRPRPRAVPR